MMKVWPDAAAIAFGTAVGCWLMSDNPHWTWWGGFIPYLLGY
jgi:hypothetical protein